MNLGSLLDEIYFVIIAPKYVLFRLVHQQTHKTTVARSILVSSVLFTYVIITSTKQWLYNNVPLESINQVIVENFHIHPGET
jgi:hypothetical protein